MTNGYKPKKSSPNRKPPKSGSGVQWPTKEQFDAQYKLLLRMTRLKCAAHAARAASDYFFDQRVDHFAAEILREALDLLDGKE